ncbi:hypothetical protein D3C78_1884080 [compost metagenome]
MVHRYDKAHREQPADSNPQHAGPEKAEGIRQQGKPDKTEDDEQQQHDQHNPPITTAAGDGRRHQA